jgi:hypothetical protein
MMLHAQNCDVSAMMTAYERSHLIKGSPNVSKDGSNGTDEISLQMFQDTMDTLARNIKSIQDEDIQLMVDSIMLDLGALRAALLPDPQRRLAELRVCICIVCCTAMTNSTGYCPCV